MNNYKKISAALHSPITCPGINWRHEDGGAQGPLCDTILQGHDFQALNNDSHKPPLPYLEDNGRSRRKIRIGNLFFFEVFRVTNHRMYRAAINQSTPISF